LGAEYALPESLRSKLARPLGRLFSGSELSGSEFRDLVTGAGFLVTVGDRVTETVGGSLRVPDVQVVDSRENRKDRVPPSVRFSREIAARNPPGVITRESMVAMKDAFEGLKPVRLTVVGEEDLLAVLAVLYAPDGTVVLYGQPGEGIVVVRVDGESKSRNREILRAMGAPEDP